MRTLTCPCGAQFEAASPRAVYCSPRCRKRASDAGIRLVPKAKPAAAPPAAAPPAAVEDVPSVTGSVIAELGAAGALSSPAGLAAVRLAQLIDSATLMQGSSVAAWSREMRAALADAKAAAPAREVDPLDELEKRRASRGA